MSDTWESVGEYVLLLESPCEANDHQEGAVTMAHKSWLLRETSEVLLPPGSEAHVKELLLDKVAPNKSFWITVPFTKIIFSSGNFSNILFFSHCTSTLNVNLSRIVCHIFMKDRYGHVLKKKNNKLAGMSDSDMSDLEKPKRHTSLSKRTQR